MKKRWIYAAVFIGLIYGGIAGADARPNCPPSKIWRPSIGVCQDRGAAMRAGVVKKKRLAMSRHWKGRTRVLRRHSPPTPFIQSEVRVAVPALRCDETCELQLWVQKHRETFR